MKKKQKAYTLMELMMVVLVAAIIFVSAMPDQDATRKEEQQAFVDQFQADVSYARSMTIADPSDPTLVKIDPSNNQYWLARKSTPSTPITHPVSRKPFRVKVGPGASRLSSVEIVGAGFGSSQAIEFDSTGSLKDDAAPLLRISVGEESVDVGVSPVAATVEVELPDPAVVVDAAGKITRGVADLLN